MPAVLALCVGLACFALTMNWARGQAQDVAAPRLPEERGVSVNLGGATVLHPTAVFYPRAAIEKGQISIASHLPPEGDGPARVCDSQGVIRQFSFFVVRILTYEYVRIRHAFA